jgi:hypothetical protein
LAAEILAEDRALGAAGANRRARTLLDEKWGKRDNRLAVIPGKKVFSRLSEWGQQEFSVPLSAAQVARALRPSEIPAEIREVLAAIHGGTQFPEM